MSCLRCGGTLGLSKILCDPCAHKALDILPSDPKERVEIYKIIVAETENPVIRWCCERLINEAREEIEQGVLGTVDIFEERG